VQDGTEPPSAPRGSGPGKRRRGRGGSTVKGGVVHAQSAGFGKGPLALPATLQGPSRASSKNVGPQFQACTILQPVLVTSLY